MRALTLDDARAATYGGLVLGAGGGGLETGLRAAESVMALGTPFLVTLDELADDDEVIVSTGIGAPGAPRTGARLGIAEDGQRCLDLVIEHMDDGGRVVGTMSSHPGAWIAGGWVNAVLRKGWSVVDCATNGRGHPLVKMGGMGLAERKDVAVVQVAAGGDPDVTGYMEIVAKGPLSLVSNVLRQASREVGGIILSARGPFSVGFCKTNAAPGAVSACITLGEAMLAAEGNGPEAMISAIADTFGGRVLGRGPLTDDSVAFEGAFDVGFFTVDAEGSPLRVAVVNEYMAADLDGTRVSTFPDLIVTLSTNDGMPTSAAGLEIGEEVVVVAVPGANIPLGAGVWDEVVYTEMEKMLGIEMKAHALTNRR